MPSWSCPSCARRFARRGQPHECAPAMSLEEYFATGPARERPIFDVVHAHLTTLGAVHVEPLSVGIYFKRARTFATLRPMTRWVALGFLLPRRVASARLSRRPVRAGASWWHVVNSEDPGDVDEVVLAWLTEAYVAAPPD